MKTILLSLVLAFILLRVQSQQLKLQFPVSHGGLTITGAMYSPNGKLLLTEQDGDKGFLWDAYSNKLIREFVGVRNVTFSRDAKLIVLTYPSRVEILNTSSLTVLFAKDVDDSRNITEAFLSNNDRNLCIITSSGWPVKTELTSIDIKNGEQAFGVKLEMENPRAGVNTDGTLIVVSELQERKAVVYEASAGTLVYTLENATSAVTKFIFSPDNKWLAAISGKKINVWEAGKGELKKTFSGHQEQVTDIDFSNSSDQLVSSSLDRSIRIWKLSTGKTIKEFKAEEEVLKVSFTPKDNYLLAGFEHFGLSVWDIEKGTGHKNLYTGMAKYLHRDQVHPDEKLVFASMYGGAKIHKLFNGEEIHEFNAHVDELKITRLSADKKRMLTINDMNGIHVWDLLTGKLITSFGIPDTMRYYTYFTDAVFSNKNTILAGLHNGDVGEWEATTGKFLGTFIPRKYGMIRELNMDVKENRLLVTGQEGVSMYQLGTMKEVFHFTRDSISIFSTTWNKERSLLVINTLKTRAYILNSTTGELISTIEKNTYTGTPLFSGQGDKLLIVTSNAYAVIYDPLTGKEISKFKTWPRDFNHEGAAIGPDGRSVYITIGSEYARQDQKIEIYDLQAGKLTASFPGLFFKKISFPDKEHALLTTANGIEKRRLSDLGLVGRIEGKDVMIDEINNRLIVKNSYAAELYKADSFIKTISFIGLGIGEGSKFKTLGGISVLPEMYYMGNKEAVSKLHFLDGLKPISFEQLDILYNRPDKVMEKLGSDISLINNSKAAYYKRVKKLGIDPAAISGDYSVPTAGFENLLSINAEQVSDKLVLQLKGSDSLVDLRSYNVWINEVPVFGAAGIDIKDKKLKKLDTKTTVVLSRGSNKIETSVTNINGIESYRMPLYVYQGTTKTADKFSGYQQYDPNKPIEEYLYFIGIGINRFEQDKYNLQWSVKDIRDLSFELKNKYGDAIMIDTLFDDMVTAENIRGLKKKLQQSKVNDKVMIAYSGHGLLSKDFDYYLSTYSISFDDPAKKGLPYSDLEDLVDNIPARRKLLLIDACHSGEVDKDDLVRLNQTPDSLIKGIKPVAYKKDGQTGLKNSFELMQDLFVNVGKSTGATIISAAAGTQFALERGDLKNGVFTYTILEAMKNIPTISVSALMKRVAERVTELTNGMQQPTSRTENKAVDWKVW